MISTLFTIGHSTHSIEVFLGLLNQHRIDVVADVRSAPHSRYNPHFNKKKLANSLDKQNIKYIFFGKELGARSNDPSCYVKGKVQYKRLAEKPEFKQAIKRLITGAQDYRIAMMCAEKEPLECHRTILVSQVLVAAGQQIRHIHADGSLEPHETALERLLGLIGIPDEDLFKSRAELLREALSAQEARIAYQSDG